MRAPSRRRGPVCPSIDARSRSIDAHRCPGERMISSARCFVGRELVLAYLPHSGLGAGGGPGQRGRPGGERRVSARTLSLVRSASSLSSTPAVSVRFVRLPTRGEDAGAGSGLWSLVSRRCAYTSSAWAQLDPSSPSTSAALSTQSTPSLLSIAEKPPPPSLRSPMAAPSSSSPMV